MYQDILEVVFGWGCVGIFIFFGLVYIFFSECFFFGLRMCTLLFFFDVTRQMAGLSVLDPRATPANGERIAFVHLLHSGIHMNTPTFAHF